MRTLAAVLLAAAAAHALPCDTAPTTYVFDWQGLYNATRPEAGTQDGGANVLHCLEVYTEISFAGKAAIDIGAGQVVQVFSDDATPLVLDGNDETHFFDVLPGASLVLHDLTLRDGAEAVAGMAVDVHASAALETSGCVFETTTRTAVTFIRAAAGAGGGVTCKTPCAAGEDGSCAAWDALLCENCVCYTCDAPCTPCIAGTHQAVSRPEHTTTCVACQAGEFSPAGAAACTVQCPAGTTVQAPDACLPCPGGSSSSGTHASSCSPCTPGTSANEGATQCTDCVAGTYAPGAAGLCTPCPIGTSSDAVAASDVGVCTACNTGFAAPAGSSACVECLENEFMAANQSTCVNCRPGSRADAQATTCEPCPIGTFEDDNACLACSPGTTALSVGNHACTPCSNNTYELDGACLSCAEGSVAEPGATACTPCSEATFAKTGWGTCMQCAPGSVSAAQATACLPCVSGKYEADNECVRCASGYVSNAGADECTACSPGTARLGNVCTSCAAGSVSKTGAGSCDVCFEGEYASANKCLACPEGTFSAASGATACTPCPADESSSVAAVACAGPRVTTQNATIAIEIGIRFGGMNALEFDAQNQRAAAVDAVVAVLSGGSGHVFDADVLHVTDATSDSADAVSAYARIRVRVLVPTGSTEERKFDWLVHKYEWTLYDEVEAFQVTFQDKGGSAGVSVEAVSAAPVKFTSKSTERAETRPPKEPMFRAAAGHVAFAALILACGVARLLTDVAVEGANRRRKKDR